MSCRAGAPHRAAIIMHRAAPVALEEELVGLSLTAPDDKPNSPRTIKRPTNPVATCLEAAALSPPTHLNGSYEEGSVTKRPKIHGEIGSWASSAQAQSTPQPGASHLPSPPSLSPLMASGRFVTSSTNGRGAAAASPVLSGTLGPRRLQESLAAPHAIFSFTTDATQSSQSRHLCKHAPMASDSSLLEGADLEAMEVSVRPLGAECGSPVAAATNSISQSLRLGPSTSHTVFLPPHL